MPLLNAGDVTYQSLGTRSLEKANVLSESIITWEPEVGRAVDGLSHLWGLSLFRTDA